MNKQQFGYKLGKLYLKFRQWQQPIWVKILFVIFTILLSSFILYILRTIIVVALILCLLVYLVFFLPDNEEERYQHAVREKARFMQDMHKQMVNDGYKRAYGYTPKYDDNVMGSGNGTGNGINL